MTHAPPPRPRPVSRTAEYRAYHDARYRCTSPKAAAYPRYGGRGIEFRFQSFEEFLAEVGPRPSNLYQLDRKNPDGHYEPGNVRWVHRLVSGLNKSKYQDLLHNLRQQVLFENLPLESAGALLGLTSEQAAVLLGLEDTHT